MEKVILVREKGTLRVWTEEDLKGEEWKYVITDKTGEYTLLDLDNTKAQFFVKAILNELELFPELRMLRMIQWMLVVLLLVCITTMSRSFFIPTKNFLIESLKKESAEKSSIQTVPRTAEEEKKKRIEEILNKSIPKTGSWQ